MASVCRTIQRNIVRNYKAPVLFNGYMTENTTLVYSQNHRKPTPKASKQWWQNLIDLIIILKEIYYVIFDKRHRQLYWRP